MNECSSTELGIVQTEGYLPHKWKDHDTMPVAFTEMIVLYFNICSLRPNVHATNALTQPKPSREDHRGRLNPRFPTEGTPNSDNQAIASIHHIHYLPILYYESNQF